MTFQEAIRHIGQGRFSPVYLITGDEPFLIDTLIQQFLEKGLDPSAHGFNLNRFHGSDTSPETILSIADTFPILSPQRMILIQSADQLKDDKGLLLDYLANPSPTSTLIFIAEKPDMRKKFFAMLKKRATLMTCPRPREREIPIWIRQESKKLGLHLSEDAIWFLKEHLGCDLLSIHQELEKLVLYQMDPDESSLKGSSEISMESVQKVTGNGRTHSIFELTNAVGNKDLSRAIQVLRAMMSEGAQPLFVLSMLVRLWRQMAIAKILIESGRTAEVAKKVPMPPSFLRIFLQQLKKWRLKEIQKAFECALSADSQLKGGALSARSVLEALLLDLCFSDQSEKRDYSLSFLSPSRNLFLNK